MQVLQSILNQVKQEIRDAEAFLAHPVITDKPYVVGRDGYWVKSVKLLFSRQIVAGHVTTDPMNAMGFEKIYAERLAAVTVSAEGVYSMQTRIEAVRFYLKEKTELLNQLMKDRQV